MLPPSRGRKIAAKNYSVACGQRACPRLGRLRGSEASRNAQTRSCTLGLHGSFDCLRALRVPQIAGPRAVAKQSSTATRQRSSCCGALTRARTKQPHGPATAQKFAPRAAARVVSNKQPVLQSCVAAGALTAANGSDGGERSLAGVAQAQAAGARAGPRTGLPARVRIRQRERAIIACLARASRASSSRRSKSRRGATAQWRCRRAGRTRAA